MVEYIRTEHAKPGDKVARTLYDDKGRLLIKIGKPLSKAGIRVIKDLGYKGLYIENESMARREDIPIPEPLISDFQCMQIISLMKDIVTCDNIKYDPFDPTFHVYKKKMEEYVKELVEIVYEHEKNNTFLLEMEDTRTFQTWLYYHSLNTCLLSIGIAIKLGLSKNEVTDIAIGALFHDVGKMFIPRELVNKINVTEKEKAEIRKHSEYGFRLFQRQNTYTVNTTYAIWFHHEREDGSGYPNGVTEERIPLSAKIVALASSYDNMINYNPFHTNPMMQSEALERLGADKRFNVECVAALMKFVVPYPVGTKVRLSDGREALVLKNVPGAPLRPYLICGRELLELSSNKNLLSLVITGVEKQ